MHLTVGDTVIPYEVRESAQARAMKIVVTPSAVEVVVPLDARAGLDLAGGRSSPDRAVARAGGGRRAQPPVGHGHDHGADPGTWHGGHRARHRLRVPQRARARRHKTPGRPGRARCGLRGAGRRIRDAGQRP